MYHNGEFDLLRLIFDILGEKNKGARGCVILITRLIVIALGIGFLWNILSRSFDPDKATLYVTTITVLGFAIYILVGITRYLRKRTEIDGPVTSFDLPAGVETAPNMPPVITPEAQPEMLEFSWMPIIAFTFSMVMALLSSLLLYGSFALVATVLSDSTAVSPPEISETIFFLLFYGIPIGCLIGIGIGIISLGRRSRNYGLSMIGMAISIIILSGFLFWHFLALGLAGAYYPCLVDIATITFFIPAVIIILRRQHKLSQ